MDAVVIADLWGPFVTAASIVSHVQGLPMSKVFCSRQVHPSPTASKSPQRDGNLHKLQVALDTYLEPAPWVQMLVLGLP
jgi:hypothetical protein